MSELWKEEEKEVNELEWMIIDLWEYFTTFLRILVSYLILGGIIYLIVLLGNEIVKLWLQ